MDAWNCERNWAKRIPTGDPGSLCAGLERSQYIPFWCIVAALTLAVYLVNSAKQAKKDAKSRSSGWAGISSWLLKKLFFKNGRISRPGLEEGLLDKEHHAREFIQISAEKMEVVCRELRCKRGLETASLAVLLTLQQRRRYGNALFGLVPAGIASARPRALDVDVTTPCMPFSQLLRAIDAALEGTALDAEAPDVLFTWGAGRPSRPGHWLARQPQPGQLELRGASVEEAKAFEVLFEAAAADPHGDLWLLPLLPEASKERVVAWGAPPKDFAALRDSKGRLRSVPELLAARPGLSSTDAIAGDGFCLSNQELSRRAGAVAHAVQERGGGLGDAVLIYMGRGEAIGVAFLGVLQAGHIVVPVDLHWPSDRVRAVAEDAQPRLALTEQSASEAWMAIGLRFPEALVVDASLFQLYGTSGKGRPVVLDQDDPAIVLFTSGSTGKPKGITLAHGYLTALISGIAESKEMNMQTRTLCYHSPTWMPFLDYLLAPLLVGGCCLYFPQGTTHVVKPSDLRSFAQRHGATSVGFVPAMLDILLEEALPRMLVAVGVGGAAVPAELCQRAVDALPPLADGRPGVLFTGYSGTEQGDVTQIRMRSVADVDRWATESGFLGAGRPHAAQRCAVLDMGLNLVGPEGIGEITVAGPGLASCYLNLPEKSAETFLRSCEALGGVRAARTGDLGLWTTDGSLKVVGRRDSMVKVRGARVELGEVEAAVVSHPGVKAAVVIVWEDQLVAYVVPAVPADLRDHCKARLVAYMVPHLFEGVEELARLPSGKVNMKALPQPQQRADGLETVMELDSLGQMRKFTRRAVSEDRILDNVRAILIGVVIQSHAIPLVAGSLSMLDIVGRPLGVDWGPRQYFLLAITRGGGWSSLAFLNGFDDTRAMHPYGLTYREPLFLALWLLLDFNWTMWYLPVFVLMRASFCAAHWLGIERLHLALAAQFWLVLPAFVDFYIGWQPGPTPPATCPSQCFCPWQAWPWGQSVAYYTSGWWVAGSSPMEHSFVGHALIFIPCYWIGFYGGGRIFAFLTKVADEPSLWKKMALACFVLALYCLMFCAGQSLLEGFDDRCSSFWGPDGGFIWQQIVHNLIYFAMNLSMSLTYVIFIAALVPVHLKYLAKICFSSLIVSAVGASPCLLNLPVQAAEMRKLVSESIAPGMEMLWVFSVPFLFELVTGAIVTAALPVGIKAVISMMRRLQVLAG